MSKKPIQPIETILPEVKKPARYLGGEVNAVYKDPRSVRLRVALLFPDLYEIGMSHLGLALLYQILNQDEAIWAERAYAPAIDLEQELRRRGVLFSSLESGTPLNNFDLVGVSLQYELGYTNFLTMLELGGISWLASNRGPDDPVVIAGGPSCCNPEPVAPFFDAILIGEGEAAILEITHLVRQWRENGGSRRELWQALEDIEGVYVPALFDMIYDAEGRFREIVPHGRRQHIRRRLIPDLNQYAIPAKPLVPQVQIVHDRLNAEIFRGCTRGCRFCQAGIIYRPVRERRPESILNWVEEALSASGFEEVSLLSLSSGDYSCLTPLLTGLMDRLVESRIAVSLPSLRADTLNSDLMQQIKRVRKTGFTIAPEAGSDRLRRAINKNLSEAEIMATVEQAFELGWHLLKMYFMIGFPMEEREDLQAIADLCRRALAAAKKINRRGKMHVSINTFIPKPHTPFQWERQLARPESQERLHLLKDSLRQRDLEIRWNPCDQSWLEGVLSRGDRRLAPVLMQAQRLGCRFDAWTEHARMARWQEAFANCQIEGDFYLRERSEDELLPWGHIHSGVSREYLLSERRRAWEGVQTPDCREAGCLECGVCDWHEVQPRLVDATLATPTPAPQQSYAGNGITRYRLHYTKVDGARWFSHLELMHLIYRSLRRSGLPLHFSQGFHPLPRVSFHGALPVGVESLAETLDIELSQPLPCPEVAARLNQVLPTGLSILDSKKLAENAAPPQTNSVFYEVKSPEQAFFPEAVFHFTAATEFWAVRRKPKEIKKIDIRPLVASIHLQDASNVSLTVKTREKDNLRIAELVAAIFHLEETQTRQLQILKQASFAGL